MWIVYQQGTEPSQSNYLSSLKKRKTKQAKEYEDKVRELGCIICYRLGRGHCRAEIHHCRFPVGGAQKADYRYAIPLAPALHRLGAKEPEWPFQDDVPIHAGDRPFRNKYGVGERELLAQVCELMGVPQPENRNAYQR